MNEEKKEYDGMNKIVCPSCKINFCYEDDYPDGSKGYLCYNCGMTSNTRMVPDSEYLEKAMISTPEFINDNKFLDEERNIYWFLSTVRTVKGIVFPEPDTSIDGGHWSVAKIVDIPEEEQNYYPIPGKDGEFYVSRLAVEDAVQFRKGKFYDACQELGGILKIHKDRD